MPEKQTRVSIEAELNATETERLINLVKEVKEILCEIDEVEAGLRQMEESAACRAIARSRSLTEWPISE